MSLSKKTHAPIFEVLVRQFQAGDESSFQHLNEEWITRYFKIEPKDAQLLAEPQRTILDRGGKILFATVDGECIGCCALLRISDAEFGDQQFEVSKMAVTPAYRGGGVGRKLLEATVEVGRSLGAKRLYLETNDSLTPAIRLYESIGFKHLPADRITPSPYARANVYMEMMLD
jgi:GNAT superfamily N-acetyltransferase